MIRKDLIRCVLSEARRGDCLTAVNDICWLQRLHYKSLLSAHQFLAVISTQIRFIVISLHLFCSVQLFLHPRRKILNRELGGRFLQCVQSLMGQTRNQYLLYWLWAVIWNNLSQDRDYILQEDVSCPGGSPWSNSNNDRLAVRSQASHPTLEAENILRWHLMSLRVIK